MLVEISVKKGLLVKVLATVSKKSIKKLLVEVLA